MLAAISTQIITSQTLEKMITTTDIYKLSVYINTLNFSSSKEGDEVKPFDKKSNNVCYKTTDYKFDSLRE